MIERHSVQENLRFFVTEEPHIFGSPVKHDDQVKDDKLNKLESE